MILRHIILSASNSGYGSEFDDKFRYNTYFMSHYLSMHIRKHRIVTDGTFNMIFISITKDMDSHKLFVSCKQLFINLHVSEEEINKYLEMHEIERFEYYLSLFERSYQIADKFRPIPIQTLLSLHDEFRDGGYKVEWLFKNKYISEYGIHISLKCQLSSYDFKLHLSVYDRKKTLIGKGNIFHTYPDSIFFWKTIKTMMITDKKLVILDYLGHPQFECDLKNMLSKGIVKPKYLDANTQKYTYNELTKSKFDKIKWLK